MLLKKNESYIFTVIEPIYDENEKWNGPKKFSGLITESVKYDDDKHSYIHDRFKEELDPKNIMVYSIVVDKLPASKKSTLKQYLTNKLGKNLIFGFPEIKYVDDISGFSLAFKDFGFSLKAIKSRKSPKSSSKSPNKASKKKKELEEELHEIRKEVSKKIKYFGGKNTAENFFNLFFQIHELNKEIKELDKKRKDQKDLHDNLQQKLVKIQDKVLRQGKDPYLLLDEIEFLYEKEVETEEEIEKL
jgi:hypothetical protein